MKIAYFGYNALMSCLELLIHRGHEIMCIYTGENDLYTDQIINFAKQHQVELIFDKPDQAQMEALVDAGVELFFAAEYPWKIPVPDNLKYAINLHPTMLPHGRGPTPLPSLLLGHSQYAGITFHKMSSELDSGDILLQQQIEIAEHESFNTLSAKLYLESPPLLDKLLSNLDNYYENSTPQGEGSYWPMLTKQEQTVDWAKSTSTLLQQFRAFGSLGVYAEINGHTFLIIAAEGVVQSHGIKPGTIILFDKVQLVVASNDGLITISRSSLIPV